MTGPVRSVSHAFAILRLLAQESPASLSDIGRRLGLSPSSGLNLLRTLIAEGVVERDAVSKLYRLAPAWAEAEVLLHDEGKWLVDRAFPMMQRLAERSGATIGLWKSVSRNRMQLMSHAESNGDVRLKLADRQRQPLGGGAVGRAIAAAQQLDDAELARRFAAVRWQVDLELAAYIDQIRVAESLGFALDRGFTHRGIWTLASAMHNLKPSFCLSATILADARSEDELAALGADLRSLCGKLIKGELRSSPSLGHQLVA